MSLQVIILNIKLSERIIYHNLHNLLKFHKMIRKILTFIPRFLFVGMFFFSRNLFAGDVTIIDSRHYSNVFGEIRNFRVFLPPGYYENPQKRYPVIYFYHGWSQTVFRQWS